MGAIIEKTAFIADDQSEAHVLIADAGSRCVEEAGVDLSSIDVLIYTGVYRTKNIMEPAFVHLIQKEMGLNLNPKFSDRSTRTFSFDILNSECGFLNATQVVGSLLARTAEPKKTDELGSVRRALVVSGDASPSGRTDERFPFLASGAAALLSWSPDPALGFGPLAVRSAPSSTNGAGIQGANHLGEQADHRTFATIEMEPAYASDALSLASEAATSYLRTNEIDAGLIDVVVSSQPTPEFSAKLASAIGAERAVDVASELVAPGDPHSASLTFGFDAATRAGMIKPGTNVLFVAVGSGMSGACSIYKA